MLPVGDVAEPADARIGEVRPVAPALAAGEHEPELAVEQPPRLDEPREVLPRFDRADPQHVLIGTEVKLRTHADRVVGRDERRRNTVMHDADAIALKLAASWRVSPLNTPVSGPET